MASEYGRGIAESYIGAVIREVGITSADNYYDWLRENDLYVPRAIVRDVWREEGAASHYSDVLERYDLTAPIPRSWYAESDKAYIDRYGVRVRVEEYNPFTGETESKSYFMTSDQSITKQKVIDWSTSLDESTSPPILGQLTSIKIEAMYHREGRAW